MASPPLAAPHHGRSDGAYDGVRIDAREPRPTLAAPPSPPPSPRTPFGRPRAAAARTRCRCHSSPSHSSLPPDRRRRHHLPPACRRSHPRLQPAPPRHPAPPPSAATPPFPLSPPLPPPPPQPPPPLPPPSFPPPSSRSTPPPRSPPLHHGRRSLRHLTQPSNSRSCLYRRLSTPDVRPYCRRRYPCHWDRKVSRIFGQVARRSPPEARGGLQNGRLWRPCCQPRSSGWWRGDLEVSRVCLGRLSWPLGGMGGRESAARACSAR